MWNGPEEGRETERSRESLVLAGWDKRIVGAGCEGRKGGRVGEGARVSLEPRAYACPTLHFLPSTSPLAATLHRQDAMQTSYYGSVAEMITDTTRVMRLLEGFGSGCCADKHARPCSSATPSDGPALAFPTLTPTL